MRAALTSAATESPQWAMLTMPLEDTKVIDAGGRYISGFSTDISTGIHFAVHSLFAELMLNTATLS